MMVVVMMGCDAERSGPTSPVSGAEGGADGEVAGDGEGATEGEGEGEGATEGEGEGEGATEGEGEGAQARPKSWAVGPLPAPLQALRPFMDKHIDVFGVHVVGTPATGEAAMKHAAGVMAQYLDNDADGVPDDASVVGSLAGLDATLVMAASARELERSGLFEADLPDDLQAFQDLYEDETHQPGRFDAALEEVHHLLYNYGWARVYPEQLDPHAESALTRAMDAARGGHFETLPTPYPEGAWYHYDDETCEYECMVTEYIYWAHTTLLGGQRDPARCREIAREWEPCTPEALRTTDAAAVSILEDPALGLPSSLPDGVYAPPG